MQFEEYSPRWQKRVIELADQILGPGFFRNPSEIAQDPESRVLLAVTQDGKLAGFACGRLLERGGLMGFLEYKVPEVPEDLSAADTDGVLGVIQTVVVAPAFQGQGIGTKLVQMIHDAIIGHGADKLIVSFKRGPASAHVHQWMEKLGFELWIQLETYWKTRCDLGDFGCIDRGDSCTCEAVLYRKRVF